MTLPELKVALDQTGVIPSRKLGQNFLHDANVARWIALQLDPQPDDCIVEVGPGTGALSEHLVGRVRKLILIEFDQRLAEFLTKKFAHEPSVQVVSEDAVRYDIRPLWAEGDVKLLGNLPYSAGGAILRNFLKGPTPVERAVIMLQKEVIDRILATPRTKAFGVLTLRMQSEWDSAPIKTVGPECFHPRPLIDSTVMMCRRRAVPLASFDRRLFDELIRRGFAQRRKMLRKAMPEEPGWVSVAQSVGCSETARPEELSVEQWVTLTRSYDAFSSEPAQNGDEVFDVVNEENEVIAQATRSEVHAKDLVHRAVHVLITDEKGQYLLQQRSAQKDKEPGKWGSSAAGHLDAGEDYEGAARRELEEELGIDPAGLTLTRLGGQSPSQANGWEFIEIFQVTYKGALRLRTNEVEAVLWMPPEWISQWVERRPGDFSESFCDLWRTVSNGLLREG